jgi:predicted nucleotidyltransferase
MLSELELRIITAFYPDPIGKTIKELCSASEYSYERANTALKSLVKMRIARSKLTGNVLTYDLETSMEESLVGFILYASERTKEFKKIHPREFEVIKRFAGTIQGDTAIIFGSYAKGLQTKKSDLDVIFVSDDIDVTRKALSMELELGIDVNAMNVPKDGFWQMRLDNPVFFEDLVNFGIVIKGYETFFELVYRWDIWSKGNSIGSSGIISSSGGPSCRRSPRFIWRRPGRTWSR